MAKGMTNGAVPAGAVAVRNEIYEAFMTGPDSAIELFHGYTYSAHPVACAAGIATQQIYRREGLLTRAHEIGGYWADAVHSLKGRPHVIDLRNLGLIGAIELEPIAGQAGRARLRHLRARLREGPADACHRRHHRAVAAAHHRALAHRSAVRPARRGAARASLSGTTKRPVSLRKPGVGSVPGSSPERTRRYSTTFSHSLPHGNVVDTENIARASLLLTSPGVPSTASRSLPSTYFRPSSKLPSV